jgi:hypothetical protein
MEEEGEGSPKSLLEKKLMIMGRGNEEVVTAQPAPTQGVVTFKDDLLEGHLMRRESSSSSSSSRRQQNPA